MKIKNIIIFIILFILFYLFLNFATWRFEQIENNPQAFGNNGKCQHVEIFKK